MLQLLQPIWLMAMAGIAFPVIIHLWNNRQGKVLLIGSITFLEKGSRKQARSRRVSEWLLLLLRCLLLLLLALLLSGPFWRLSPAGQTKKGWIMVGKEDAEIQAYKPMIDSLLLAGYERHEWENGPAFRGRSGSEEGRRAGSGEGMGAGHERLSYWDLFRRADREAPAGIPFYIFTSGRRSGFSGTRPASGRMVHWYAYTPSGDPVSYHLSRAWLSSADSIRVLMAGSRPTGSSYSYQVLPAKAGVMAGGYQVGHTNGHLSVTLDSQPPVIVDTGALRIQIYADNKYNDDSRYLAAAVHALRQFTRRNIQLNVTGEDHDGISHPDWVFWLSSQPVPAGLAAANVVCYEPGREISADTWMQGTPGVSVEKLARADSANYPAIWKDGFGRPILALETRSGRRIFHFFSHFDPAWNGLVWSPRFPVLLEELLFRNDDAGDRDRDRRVLDPAQILPQKVSSGEGSSTGEGNFPKGDIRGNPEVDPERGGKDKVEEVDRKVHSAKDKEEGRIDLTPVCWILIFLLFLTERLLSFRSPKLKSYG